MYSKSKECSKILFLLKTVFMQVHFKGFLEVKTKYMAKIRKNCRGWLLSVFFCERNLLVNYVISFQERFPKCKDLRFTNKNVQN